MSNLKLSPNHDLHVIDGGALLHMVPWKNNVTYGDICEQYCSFLNKKYGECIVIFDGYNNGPSIKDHEQSRRSEKMLENIKVEKTITAHKNQQQFLANNNNKSVFITLLSSYLGRHYAVHQSINDADTLVVHHALQNARLGRNTTVVADDTDILVLLMYHYCKETMSDIHFRSEATKRSKLGLQVYSIKKAVECNTIEVVRNLLFLHAWSGCDTTSSIFGHGKGSVMKLMNKSKQSINKCEAFHRDNINLNELKIAGDELMSLTFGGKADQKLCSLRYTKYFNQLTTSTSKTHPETLPPTSRSTYFHSLRVYLQVSIWRHLGEDGLNPIDWGWNLADGKFEPVMTDIEPGPPEILNVIRCKCKITTKGQCSNNVCSCRKHGLSCVSACQECRGCDCMNATKTNTEELDDELNFDRNIFDIFEN